MPSRVRRSMLGAALMCAMFALQFGFAGTSAQDVPSQVGPVKPSPALCTVEPRTVDELTALFAGATPTDPVDLSTSATIHFGQPANPEAAQHVTALIHQAFACLNAGDFGRFMALMSDQVILSSFLWVQEMLADEASAAEALIPQEAPEEFQQTLLGIGSISQLPDGRHSAVVVGIDPSGSEAPFALYLVVAEQNGTWMFDEIIEFDMAE